jgi:hypothetical protein
LAIKYKKVTSRKKVGEQARAIIVAVPKEEEEIVDMEVRQRRRGRPRKIPETDPPDPRKGSVPDPGKGVRADPVNRGAILEGEGPGPPSGDKERQLRKGKRKDVTKCGDGRKSRKKTPSWLQNASLHRVSSRVQLKKKV